jgi:hypothetical protein
VEELKIALMLEHCMVKSSAFAERDALWNGYNPSVSILLSFTSCTGEESFSIEVIDKEVEFIFCHVKCGYAIFNCP